MKRELSALDIIQCDQIINPVEFIKTKNHCYLIKEYANWSIAEILLYRSQLGMELDNFHQGKLSERETQMVIRDLLIAIKDLYKNGLAIWDLSPENLMLSISTENNH